LHRSKLFIAADVKHREAQGNGAGEKSPEAVSGAAEHKNYKNGD